MLFVGINEGQCGETWLLLKFCLVILVICIEQLNHMVIFKTDYPEDIDYRISKILFGKRVGTFSSVLDYQQGVYPFHDGAGRLRSMSRSMLNPLTVAVACKVLPLPSQLFKHVRNMIVKH